MMCCRKRDFSQEQPTKEAKPCRHKEGAPQLHTPLLCCHNMPDLMHSCIQNLTYFKTSAKSDMEEQAVKGAHNDDARHWVFMVA